MTKKVLLTVGALLALVIIVAGIRVGLLLRSIGSYRTYWQNEAAKSPVADSIIYIALGDSAAQGIGASSPRLGYVGLSAAYIAQQTGRPVKVINISVSGAKLADVIKLQLPQLASLPTADYFTIEAGANDIGSFNESKFKSEFETLLKDLPKGAIVANMPSFNGGRKGHVNKRAYSATQIINNLVAERTDLYLANLYDSTINQGLLDFGADLFHPSNKGYKNWAKAFTDAIAKTNK